VNLIKLGATIAAGAYGVACALRPTTYGFLDGVDLIFHEAGHVIFSVLGEIPGLLGGTVMQLLIPAGAAAGFLHQRQPHSATVTLVWLAQSFFNVSVYVRDARAQALPLLGGEHDWNSLLGRARLLPWDQVIGGAVYALGLAALLVAILGGVILSRDTPDADAKGARR
jgi:hypothetical protein